MKLPSTREETDKILFELLEGNLPQKEEEFWYDYSLKNEDFAKQLALFRKMYMKEDISSYPNHAQLLRKTTLFAKLKWPMIISSSLVFLLIVAFYMIDKNSSVESTQPTTKPITNEAKQENQQMSIPDKAEKALISKPNTKKKQADKEKPKIENNVLVDEEKQPFKIEKPIIVADSIPKKIEETPTLQRFKTLEELNKEPFLPEKQEVEQSRTPEKSTSIKFKVKPSRKTKTTDFNY